MQTASMFSPCLSAYCIAFKFFGGRHLNYCILTEESINKVLLMKWEQKSKIFILIGCSAISIILIIIVLVGCLCTYCVQ